MESETPPYGLRHYQVTEEGTKLWKQVLGKEVQFGETSTVVRGRGRK